MKTFFKNIASGFTIFITIIICSTIYASLSSVGSGDTLTADKWNELIGTMNTFSGALDGGLASPTGAVMAFNRTSCPSGWLAADGIESPLDLRGRFIRGLGGSENGQDIARALGSIQDDQMRPIEGNFSSIGVSNGSTAPYDGILFSSGPTISGNGRYSAGNNGGKTGINFNSSFLGDNFDGSDTHPKNIALIYCVKA